MNKIKTSIIIKTTFLLLFVVLSCNIFSQIPKKPSTPRLVNDFAGLFTLQQIAELEAFLEMADDSSSNQICVVTVKDLAGMEPNQFATQLGINWGVGDKEFNNGIVVLIKPKTEFEKGEVFIAQGYGLEGILPDVSCKQIIDEIMIPYFKQNDYYGGTYAACETLYKVAKGEINIKKKKSQGGGSLGKLLFLIIVIVLFIVLTSKKGNNNNNKDGHTSYGGGALPWLLMGSMMGGSRSSGGGFSSGGGGFGGFGGGSFGGGGAGGSW